MIWSIFAQMFQILHPWLLRGLGNSIGYPCKLRVIINDANVRYSRKSPQLRCHPEPTNFNHFFTMKSLVYSGTLPGRLSTVDMHDDGKNGTHPCAFFLHAYQGFFPNHWLEVEVAFPPRRCLNFIDHSVPSEPQVNITGGYDEISP